MLWNIKSNLYGEILRSRSRVVALAQRMESEPSFALTFNLYQSVLGANKSHCERCEWVQIREEISNNKKE